MGLFELDEDGILTLCKEEIRAVPEFAKILRRDLGYSVGGKRIKKKAFREFKYIFFVYDYGSPYANASFEERKEKAIKDCGLDAGFKPDKEIREAINYYIEQQDLAVPSMGILVSLERGLVATNKIINALVGRMNKILENFDEEDNSKNIDVEGLISQFNTLMTMAKEIPNTLDNVEKIRSKVMTEKGGGAVKRGNQVKSNREDPDYIKKKFAITPDLSTDVDSLDEDA